MLYGALKRRSSTELHRVAFKGIPQRLKPPFGRLDTARLKSCPSRAYSRHQRAALGEHVDGALKRGSSTELHRVAFKGIPQRLKPLFGRLDTARLKSCPSRAYSWHQRAALGEHVDAALKRPLFHVTAGLGDSFQSMTALAEGQQQVPHRAWRPVRNDKDL